jgi:WD40 repeat protein/energy-coupling factor transporter ATP-binding protein EcfA2
MARYGLVIGVDQYRSPLGNLSKTRNDAKTVADLLERHGDFTDIQELIGEVTGQQLKKALRQLLTERADRQEAFIYYTGHAVVWEGRGYFALSDTILETSVGQIAVVKNGIPLDYLKNLISEAELSSLVIILDCCHSETFLEESRGFLQSTAIDQEFLGLRTDYFLVSACRRFEEAYALHSEDHSIFTGALLQALSRDRANDRGVINAGTMFDSIENDLRGKGQEARCLCYGGAPIILDYRQVINPPIKEDCPYVGLNTFDKTTSQWFFGRDKVFNELMHKINKYSFALVVGASGIGKSSLVKAKLIPEMEKKGYRILLMKPSTDPIQNLKEVFISELEEIDDIIEIGKNIKQSGLLKTISDLLIPEPQIKIFLVIDQFEEIFTICQHESDRNQFITMLTDVAKKPPEELIIAITMRADFMSECTHPDLGDVINNQMIYIPGMDKDELKEVIIQPSKVQGYDFSDGLLETILIDIENEQNCLPLLEFVLQELWEERDKRKRLMTLEGYYKIERLRGALNRHAEKLYAAQTENGKEWMRRILLKLVRTGKDTRDTSQRVKRRIIFALAGDNSNKKREITNVLKSLEGKKGRLLVASEEKNLAIIDLTHEILIESWKRFAEWRSEDRELRRLEDRIQDSYEDWKRHEKEERYLLSGGLMDQSKPFEGRLQHFFHPELQEFYMKSKKHEQNLSDERDSAKTKGLLIEYATKSKRLIKYKVLKGSESLVRAIYLAGENLKREPQSWPHAVQDTLYEATLRVVDSNIFHGHEADVWSVAFSRDGQKIISCSSDGTLRLWNLHGKPIGEPFYGHEGQVLSVAFSPDGETIISGGIDRTLRLWNLQGNQIGDPFCGHNDQVSSVAFSPDGKTIISGSYDHTLRLWDLYGNQISEPFCGHTNYVSSVAFNPGGDKIVSGSADKSLILWDLYGNQISEPFYGHTNYVSSVAFSPDGNSIVSGSYDKTLRLWNLDGTSIGSPFLGHNGHDGQVSSVAFSPNGETIVSGSYDGTLRLWDLQGKRIGSSFKYHQDCVRTVAFNHNGTTIISGSKDKTLVLWDLQGNQIGIPFTGHDGYVRAVAFSPDGKHIVSGSDDCTLRLWDLQGKQIGEPFRGHTNFIRSVAFSRDSQMIVSGSYDGTLLLWNLQGEQISEPFQGHTSYVRAVAFSPEDDIIVSGSEDKTIRCWDLQGKPIGQPFTGHTDYVWSVAFSLKGKMIVSGSSDNTLLLWNLQGEKISKPFQGHTSYVRSVAFSPKDDRIVSGSHDGTLRLWDLQGNQIGEPFQGHLDCVRTVAFSPDGKTIVSGSEDQSLILWDLDGNQIGSPFLGHKNFIWSVAFSPDGKTIVSGSWDKTLRLWHSGWKSWLEIHCSRLRNHPIFKNPPDDLTREACEICQKYVWDAE